MKKLGLFLAFALGVVFIHAASAQDFPKADFLSTMNSFDDIGLNLSSSQSDELKDLNTNFVDDISAVLKSDKDHDSKVTDLKRLKNDTKKKGIDILGEDNFKKYKKSMKKKLRPFKAKTKMLKVVI